ncbi:glycosyltransferase [uncultured Chitinophaga sp.]|jgi:Glycosyltransferases involved in cell wall biogenesis|uniref:glycosyltransferase family 2 protein n=1 Tax=uncultured Chitinophaga sp. TaxID=339340 RepID=UPI00261824BC|nr:glycosyltransferase [uncultured Chitinophaga sp.]
MEAPLVSITCITYNHEKYIAQAIEGFLMQETSFPYEIIIGEDCSTDNTRKVIGEYVKQYPGLITLITSDENVGARKNGIRVRNAARGKYIAICEGDDYWTDPHKLQKQVDFLEAHPDYVLCYHYVNRVDKDNVLITPATVEADVQLFGWKDFFHLHVPPLSMMFRNCLTHYPDEFLKCFNGDAFLLGLLSSHGKIAKLGFIGAHYRRHPGGVYSRKGKMENIRLSLATRCLMLKCSYFSREQHNEIRRQVFRWRKIYLYYFFKLNFRKMLGYQSE